MLECPKCSSDKLKDIGRVGGEEICFVCQGCKSVLLLNFVTGEWSAVKGEGIKPIQK